MEELKLKFENEKMKNDFIGWFLDGGGEYEYNNSREMRDKKNVDIKYIKPSDLFCEGINFCEYDDEE